MHACNVNYARMHVCVYECNVCMYVCVHACDVCILCNIMYVYMYVMYVCDVYPRMSVMHLCMHVCMYYIHVWMYAFNVCM